jgi:hypothetical protein
MHSLTHTCWKLRVLARWHACPRFESHVRFNTSLHACTYSSLNARLHEGTFDARRHLRTLAFILNARYYKKKLKIYRYTPCRPEFRHRVSATGTNWILGWVAQRTPQDAEARIKNLCCCRGPNLDRPIVQPVVSFYTAWRARHSYVREIFHGTTLEASMKSHTLEYKTLQSGMQATMLEVALIFTHATSLYHHIKHTSSYAEETHACAHGLHDVR